LSPSNLVPVCIPVVPRLLRVCTMVAPPVAAMIAVGTFAAVLLLNLRRRS